MDLHVSMYINRPPPPPPPRHSYSKFTAHEQLSTLAVCSHWVTFSTCTGDVIVDRRSFVSRGHPSTTQLYTSGWTCMKWTGGRVTSGGERWTHTRGKQKHSFSSAYRTLPFQHTQTISVRSETSLTGIPLPLPSLATTHLHLPTRPSPPLPYPSLPLSLLLSLNPSPFTSQSSLSLSENSSSFSVRANLKLLSPPTIKNQAG